MVDDLSLSKRLTRLEGLYARRFGHETPREDLGGSQADMERQASAMQDALKIGEPIPGWADRQESKSCILRESDAPRASAGGVRGRFTAW